ncbi:MAG: DUF4180 domain-containing protein [Acidobacteriota bacterium]
MSEEPKIIKASDVGIFIRTVGDISDAIAAALGAEGLMLTENELGQEFFDLRSGIAGEFFQKLVNYRIRAAIVLPNPERFGERFSELAYEHASHPMIRVVATQEVANIWLFS